ncbi:MAG: hypothetical protein ACOC97_01760 [Myxococcota bacterium]
MGGLGRGCGSLVLVWVAGCTLVYSGEKHQGAPEVRIDPAEPGTLDDLEAVVVTPSSRLDGPDVTYEHAWRLEGEDTPRATGRVLPSEETAKGQTWTVTVTPTSGDRTGPSGQASVTVVNTPPRVKTVGLSNYRPTTDDTLRAYPVVQDPDGDEVDVSFEWIRNGSTPVAAVTGDTIELGERGFGPGDTVEIEVTATDDEGGDTGRGGPAPVTQAATGWRPLMPNRFQPSNDGNAVVLDADGHRLVLLARYQLWELPLDEPRRYVRLVPEGEGPEDFRRAHGAFVAEPEEGHLFVVQKDGSTYRLDVERGAERWTRLTDEDTGHGGLFHPAVFVDRARERLVLYDETGLYSHPLSGGAWSAVSSEPVPSVMGAAWLHEPGTDVAYLVGGSPPGAEEPFEGATDEVWALDLATDTFTLLDAPAPGLKAWPASAVDVEGRKGYLIEGLSDVTVRDLEGFSIGDEVGSPEVWELDFDTLEWRVVTDAEGPVPPRRFGTASFDPEAGRILHTAGQGSEDWRSDVVAIDPENGERTAVDVVGMHVPLPTYEASHAEVRDNRLVIIGGQGPFFDRIADVWSFSMPDERWTRIEPAEDPEHGAPPPASAMGWHSAPVTSSILLFGGHDGDQVLDATWELTVSDDSAAWTRVATSTTPDARHRASMLSSCSLVFGGEESVLAAFRDGFQLTCSGATCDWEERLDMEGFDRAPDDARLAYTQDRILAIGEITDEMYVYSANRCPGATEEWVNETSSGNVSGEPPPGRDEHTVTALGTTRFLVHAGASNDNSTWELRAEGDGWAWEEIVPQVSEAYPEPLSREGHAAAWHEDLDRLIVFGGRISGGYANDVWELRFAE